MTPAHARVADAFRDERKLLWALAYRMTGVAADADDVVQEAFEHAVTRPPSRLDEPLRPWLVTVTLNAARDALRRRKRRGYVGPWLPSPVEDPEPPPEPAADARYELRESASFAFLVAAEALSPSQRAVLLLRDVLDFSVREVASALEMTETAVKVTHHRARRAMEGYDRARPPRTGDPTAATRAALERFLGALLAGDAAAAMACLADGVRLVSDGGGEFHAARRPVLGPDRVARFFLGLARKHGPVGRFDVRTLNGAPALVAEYDAVKEGWGRRFVLRVDLDAAGAVREVHVIVASSKLTAVAPVRC